MRKRCNAVLGWVRLATAVALILGVVVPVVLPTESVASVNTVQFSTSPALYPAFDPAVSDYVVRATSNTPVQVTVTNTSAADTTTTVSVDGQTPRTGAFTAQVSLALGQGFKITATQGATSKVYYVRSLPDGFPTWTSQRPGSPQAEYYVVVPVPSTGVGIANRYVTIYDTDGVPIWWTRPENPHRPVDAKLLPNDDILWTESDTTSSIRGLKAEHRHLDGSIVDDDIEPNGYQLDAHEVQLLSNGNYLVIGGYGKCCCNLSSYGGPASATIRDDIIQEVTPAGAAVWTWKANDHIGIDELQQLWGATFVAAGSPYDVFHLNSAVKDAAGDLLISFRHLNAIYKIRDPGAQTNPGKIIWKLGGATPTMEPGTKLTVSGDSVFTSGGGFGGQHYPRWFDAGDGQLYVTLHDNGSSLGRPPRGVRYRINEAAKTATLIEDVRDNASPNMTSPCCGSAEKLPTGNWVMSWGQNTLMTELTPSGSRVFALTFGAFSYRVDSVLAGEVIREQLRAGMDAQYPRASSNTPPTISIIANQIINEDTTTAALAFTIGDAQTTAANLTLSKGSSNTTLVPTNNIVFGGSNSNRTVTVTPATNQNGSVTITVSVSDGQLGTSTNFLLTVNAVNDAPTITGISNQTINVNGTNGPLNFMVGDVETAAGSLTLGKGSSNVTLVPTNKIVFGGSSSNRTVTVTPAANQNGSATITISVSDGAFSASNSFVLTVNVPVVTVPNVVGQTQTTATNAILSANLSVGSISNALHSIVTAGSVISQNPVAATSVPVGSPVSLVVSLGATAPAVSQAAYQNGVFQLSVPTLSGKLYILQFVDQLPGTNWADLQSVNGDGTVRVLIDSTATNQHRFYRVRIP